MTRELKIYYTTDTHCYLAPVNYATGQRAAQGIANCIANFKKDGNTLVIDGGDSMQGSPFAFFLHKEGDRTGQLMAPEVVSTVMNIGGYDFYTLGNHEFNYGKQKLQSYIDGMKATCLCANVEGLDGVRDYVIVTLENGLRVGICGITTHYINVWERPENLEGITITKPVHAAEAAYEAMVAEGCDVTVCVYHGGFECDLKTGRVLSASGENQAYRICEELNFDVLLTGHQHICFENECVHGTYTCQTTDKARTYAYMQVTENSETHTVTAVSQVLPAGDVTCQEAMEYLKPYEAAASEWFDSPVGHLDTELLPGDRVVMAALGSRIANFFNQVQLEASGADISCTALGNEIKGFSREVTIRDVVATYIYQNTLKTVEITGAILKQFMERCAEYFVIDDNGELAVSRAFLEPKIEHYNYDYVAGIEAIYDIRRPAGDRVVSMRFKGEQVEPDTRLSMCMNNYRASGTGRYDFLRGLPVVREQPTEISEMIMEYIYNRGNITVDKTKWLKVVY